MTSTPTQDLAASSPDQPSPRKVEEKNWSHQAGDLGTLRFLRPLLAAGPVQAIPPLERPPDHGDRSAPE
jgi:hypothetical protein